MLPQYAGQMSFFGGGPPLGQNVGYAIVLGFGILLCFFTLVLVSIDRQSRKVQQTSEFFNTAGRAVKTGLTAAVICSQWTWTSTVTDSSTSAWRFGVSGPYWHAAGATIQVLLFSVVAIELKRKSRNAHTVCELVLARWGRYAHVTFLFFCLLTNMISTAALLLSGASFLHQLTGMDVWLCCFLVPWTVVLYTVVGGLRAKFLADYVHVTVTFIVLIIAVYTVYVKQLGSDIIYNGLQTVASYSPDNCKSIFSPVSPGSQVLQNTFFAPGNYACGPVVGNRDGSYVTMLSSGGTIYGILQIFSNFGTIFVDQAYWQSAIAAEPSSAGRGIFWGALAWFTIPFSLGTALGLAAVSLQLPINATEASAGLVAPAISQYLLGSAGPTLLGIMTFMAVTSGVSGECLAVSSLFSYDIYKVYWRPAAEGKDILYVSRVVVVVFGLGMGALASIINAFGITAGWLYLLMGIIIGSSVFPLWNLLMWKDASGPGAISAAWIGTGLAIGTWLLVAAGKFGTVSVTTLGSTEAMIAGNIMALLSGGLIHGWLSFMSPQNYDFRSMGEIQLLDDDQSGLSPALYEHAILKRQLLWVVKWSFVAVFNFLLAWPLWALPAVVFSQGYFSYWIFISLAWAFAAGYFIVYTPLSEYAVYQGIILPFLWTLTGSSFFAPEVMSAEAVDETEIPEVKMDNLDCIIGAEDLDVKAEDPTTSQPTSRRRFATGNPGSCLWFCPLGAKSSSAVAAPAYV